MRVLWMTCAVLTMTLSVAVVGESQKLDLHGQTLTTVELSNYRDRLAGANLAGCTITGVDELRKFDFNCTGANLRGATIKDCYLIGAKFVDADLTGTRIKNCSLNGVSFEDAEMKNCFLEFVDQGDNNFRGTKHFSAKQIKFIK